MSIVALLRNPDLVKILSEVYKSPHIMFRPTHFFVWIWLNCNCFRFAFTVIFMIPLRSLFVLELLVLYLMFLSFFACFSSHFGRVFSIAFWMGCNFFKTSFNSENVVSTFLYSLGRELLIRNNFLSEFWKHCSIFLFFQHCCWDVRCLEDFFPLFWLLFSFLEVWRIFFLRVMKFYVICHGVSLFLSISAGFRIVSLNLEFISSVLEISLNNFFDFLSFVFSIPSLEFLWVSYWVSWVSLTFLSVFIYFPFLFLYLPTFWEIFLNFIFQFLHEGLFSASIFIISKHLISENIFNAVFVL